MHDDPPRTVSAATKRLLQAVADLRMLVVVDDVVRRGRARLPHHRAEKSADSKDHRRDLPHLRWHRHPGRCNPEEVRAARAGHGCAGDDLVYLATGVGVVDQRPSSGSTEPAAPELRGNFVADLNGPLDWWCGEATRAHKPTVPVVDEELALLDALPGA